ncbi:MAG: dephospho-CoA kinase, partial [Candidatus Thiodiazotropha sp.]
MLVIALTGGIGCGKSAVSSLFESLSVPVIDADQLAHQLVKPGMPALLEIQQAFGDKIIDSSGKLDRSTLRRIVFNDTQQRKCLEGILHPRIIEEIEAWISEQTAPYVLLVIPLLFETDQLSLADRILVVDCHKSVQMERVLKRDQLSREQILKIINTQADRQTRLQGADDIIENNGSMEDLKRT